MTRDVVLVKGIRKIGLPTAGGFQEVTCIELNFLPLWLAKINANIIDNSLVQDRLVDYQLNAKDVLAEAFLENKRPTQPAPNESQRLRAEAMYLNAKTRQAKVMKETALEFQSKLSNESIHLLIGGITEILMGKSLLPLPTIEKTYSATDIGSELNVSSNRIGKLANTNNLKTEEYGINVLDKSPYSTKQVTAFRYNERGREKLRELLNR